jgi:hypothetical protein
MKLSEKIKREVALLLPFEGRDIVANMRLAKKIVSAIRLHDRHEQKLTRRATDASPESSLKNKRSSGSRR